MKGPDLPGEVGAYVTRPVRGRGGTGVLAEPKRTLRVASNVIRCFDVPMPWCGGFSFPPMYILQPTTLCCSRTAPDCPQSTCPHILARRLTATTVTSWNLSVLVEFAVRPRPVHREPKTPAPLVSSGAGVGFRDNLRP
jgi:hypothetical protein